MMLRSFFNILLSDASSSKSVCTPKMDHSDQFGDAFGISCLDPHHCVEGHTGYHGMLRASSCRRPPMIVLSESTVYSELSSEHEILALTSLPSADNALIQSSSLMFSAHVLT